MNDPETAGRIREITEGIKERWPDPTKLLAARRADFDVRHKSQADYESEQKGVTG
jgi:hypothetical protein